MSTSHRRGFAVVLVCLVWSIVGVRVASAYNHEQHQGIIAIGYKAMVAAALEKGCGSPIPFSGSPPPSLRTYPAGVCQGSDASCRTRWAQFLDDIDHSIVALRDVNTALPPPYSSCPDPGSGGQLGDVTLAVDRYYERDAGRERNFCGIPPDSTPECSLPLGLCDAGSIYRFLSPSDHSGDVLGYWATEPDDDGSVTALGFKPTNAAGLGRTLDQVNDVLEDGATAILVPIVCAFDFLFGGDLDCLDKAKSLADDAIPVEELHSAMPVFGALRDANSLTGLWHFQQLVPGADHDCDDRRGMLYEGAGPQLVPDAVDVGLIVINDLAGVTLNYAESTGTTRFNLTDPGDGDQASCGRGRADWEFGTIGHTQFSPLDNLALYGWKRFVESEFLYDRDLGWPLHAIGDAVAPHHVAGTTGWGHRPFEDAAALHWPRIVFLQTLETGDAKRRLQYEQLRRILAWAFHYALVIDELRAERPLGERQNVIPVRAFITQIGLDTLAETTEPVTGAPRWPFDPTISTPYILDENLKTQFLTVVYGTEDGIARTRALLERGAGAAASFLSAVWPLTVATLPDAARCDVAQPGAGFFQCGADSSCVSGCCVPEAICPQTCTTGDECDIGASCVNGCCEGGIR